MRFLKLVGNCSLLLLFLTALFEGASEAAINTELVPSTPSPAPLGTTVTWTAKVIDTDVGDLWYRFSVRPTNGNAKVVRDFSSSNSFDWTMIESEGVYVIAVEVRNQI